MTLNLFRRRLMDSETRKNALMVVGFGSGVLAIGLLISVMLIFG
jgi:hypothetical protein